MNGGGKSDKLVVPEKGANKGAGQPEPAERREHGSEKPETFDFLGFTHLCGKTRKGRFCVKRITMHKRMRAKLKALAAELRVRLHGSIPENGAWLGTILKGHYQYYGLHHNTDAMNNFRHWVSHLRRRMLIRRSGKSRVTWQRMQRLIDKWLPKPRITQPYPSERFIVKTQGRSPVR